MQEVWGGLEVYCISTKKPVPRIPLTDAETRALGIMASELDAAKPDACIIDFSDDFVEIMNDRDLELAKSLHESLTGQYIAAKL